MPGLIVVSRSGEETRLDAETGLSVMEAIRNSGFDEILALCGGCLSCATCHVYVDDAVASDLPAMSEAESDLLDSSGHRRPNSRLSCQIRLDPAIDPMKVIMAPED